MLSDRSVQYHCVIGLCELIEVADDIMNSMFMKQIMRHSLLPGAVDSIMVELERGLNESQIRYITHEVFVGLEYLHSLKGWFDLRWRPYCVVREKSD